MRAGEHSREMKSLCKGPEVNKYLAHLRNLQKAKRVGTARAGWKVPGDEVAGGQVVQDPGSRGKDLGFHTQSVRKSL